MKAWTDIWVHGQSDKRTDHKKRARTPPSHSKTERNAWVQYLQTEAGRSRPVKETKRVLMLVK